MIVLDTNIVLDAFVQRPRGPTREQALDAGNY
jgi:predicted nucleic acid-binding protein